MCLAYGVLDRVFSVLRVRRRLLKVLAAASLSLAIKYIEDDNNQSYARFLCDVRKTDNFFISENSSRLQFFVSTIAISYMCPNSLGRRFLSLGQLEPHLCDITLVNELNDLDSRAVFFQNRG